MPAPGPSSPFLSSPWLWLALALAMLVVASLQFSDGATVWGLVGVGIALGAGVRAWLARQDSRRIDGD